MEILVDNRIKSIAQRKLGKIGANVKN